MPPASGVQAVTEEPRTLAREVALASELVEFDDEAALAMVLDVDEPPTLRDVTGPRDRGRRA